MSSSLRPAGRAGDPQARTYRTLPARITGWGLLVVAVVVAGLLVRSARAADGDYLVPVATLGLALALVWVVLLRPCVELSGDGVVLRNLVTDVEVPFARLREVDDNWALELIDATGRKHSSWAVPTRRDFRPRTLGEDFAESTTRARSREGVHAKAVAGEVEHRWQRWRLEGGVAETDAPAHRRVALAAVVPLAVAAALWALVLLR